jgi:hypothetical protein
LIYYLTKDGEKCSTTQKKTEMKLKRTWYVSTKGRTWDSATLKPIPLDDDLYFNRFICTSLRNKKTGRVEVNSRLVGAMVKQVFSPRSTHENETYVFHTDHDYRNDDLINLEWCTRADFLRSCPAENKGILKPADSLERESFYQYWIVQIDGKTHRCQTKQQARQCYDQCAYRISPRYAFLYSRYRKEDMSFLQDPTRRFCFCRGIPCHFEDELKLPAVRKIY